MSTVRSLPKLEIEKNPTNGWKRRHLGFIMDEHQINVAITRAKRGLIILGMWKQLDFTVVSFDYVYDIVLITFTEFIVYASSFRQ